MASDVVVSKQVQALVTAWLYCLVLCTVSLKLSHLIDSLITTPYVLSVNLYFYSIKKLVTCRKEEVLRQMAVCAAGTVVSASTFSFDILKLSCR